MPAKIWLGTCCCGCSYLRENGTLGTQPVSRTETDRQTQRDEQNHTEGKLDRKRSSVTSHSASHRPICKHTLKATYPRWCWTQSHNIHSFKTSAIFYPKKHLSFPFLYNKYFGLLADILHPSLFCFFIFHRRKLRPWISVLRCMKLKYLAFFFFSTNYLAVSGNLYLHPGACILCDSERLCRVCATTMTGVIIINL